MTGRLRQIGKQWWITGFDGVLPMGPYYTKREAECTRVRVGRFLKNQDKPRYVTCDKFRKK